MTQTSDATATTAPVADTMTHTNPNGSVVTITLLPDDDGNRGFLLTDSEGGNTCFGSGVTVKGAVYVSGFGNVIGKDVVLQACYLSSYVKVGEGSQILGKGRGDERLYIRSNTVVGERSIIKGNLMNGTRIGGNCQISGNISGTVGSGSIVTVSGRSRFRHELRIGYQSEVNIDYKSPEKPFSERPEKLIVGDHVTAWLGKVTGDVKIGKGARLGNKHSRTRCQLDTLTVADGVNIAESLVLSETSLIYQSLGLTLALDDNGVFYQPASMVVGKEDFSGFAKLVHERDQKRLATIRGFRERLRSYQKKVYSLYSAFKGDIDAELKPVAEID